MLRLGQSILFILLAAGFCLSTTGCYTFHVYQVGGPAGREQGNQPGTEWQHKTVHAFAWGLVRQDTTIAECRLANGDKLGIEELKVETNFGYVLISGLTLGIWVPLEISWRCAKPPVASGVLGGAGS